MRSKLIAALAAGAFLSACTSAPKEPPPAPPPPPAPAAPPQINPAADTRPSPVAPVAPMPAGPAVGSPADFAAKTGGGQQQRVYFDYDKYNVRNDAITSLQAQASYMKANPNTTFDIEGNADERGTPEYNVALSERRANSVREYLAGQGIGAARLKIVPRGETMPVATGSNEQAWQQNRNALTKQTN